MPQYPRKSELGTASINQEPKPVLLVQGEIAANPCGGLLARLRAKIERHLVLIRNDRGERVEVVLPELA
jgi:hypothetical protein